MLKAIDLPLFLLFALPIGFYDAREYRIPDLLSLGGILAFLLLHILRWNGEGGLWDSVTACALGFGSFWLIRTVSGGKLGLGDAKFSALIAVAAGLSGWFAALLVASVAGLLWAAVMMGIFRADRRMRIPFAPFLGLGGTLAIAFRNLYPLWGGV